MGDFEKFYNKALRFLSYRPRSEKEVRDRLNIKYQSFDKLRTDIKNLTLVIEKVIQKLKEQKFINDEEFAKWWIEQRTTFKPRSLRLIKLELRQKGVPDETIEDQISILRQAQDKNQIGNDLERAKKLVEIRIKRFQNLVGMTREEMYQKLVSYLARRGFDWETIKQSIDESLFKEYT